MDITERTETFIKELLHFKLTYDVSKYVTEKQARSWRDFEEEMHVDYPITGCGLIANKQLLNTWSIHKETLLHFNEALCPDETGAEIDNFPRDTTAVVYIFSLLEAYGNDVCDELNPNYRNKHQAWHHGVYADSNFSSDAEKRKMIEHFCKPFGFDPSGISEDIVEATIQLKKQRNYIVHELKHTFEFELFFRFVLAIVCSIYFGWSEKDIGLKIYPWQDYDNKYKA